MTTLKINIRDEVWPEVVRALEAGYGFVPDGVPVKDWATEIAAAVFAERVAELMKPPRPRPAPTRRIRPSRARI